MRQFVFGALMSTIVVRTPGDPLARASALQKAVWDVDPNHPVVKVQTMEDVVASSIWRPRFSAWIFSVLGGLAVLLTSAGVYGVGAYTTPSLRSGHPRGARSHPARCGCSDSAECDGAAMRRPGGECSGRAAA